ncbi:MAG: hypothetical protein NVSMB9_08550 [Isosphaeraceae bacterium]
MRRTVMRSTARLPMHRGAFFLRAGILAACFAGCGETDTVQKKAVYPVKGSVILPDGKPLTMGRVVFVPKDGLENSTATLGANGSFSLNTAGSGEGAPPGEYQVRIEPDESTLPKARGSATQKAQLPFAGKYSDESSSELTATIKPEPNELPPFKLTRQVASRSRGKR